MKDYKETAQKIMSLAGNNGLREKMGLREMVKGNFSPRIMAQKYIEIYKSLNLFEGGIVE